MKQVISATQEFVLCLPSFKQKNDILYCGHVSGWDEDKLKKCKLQILPAKKVKTPLLAAHVSGRKDKVYNAGDKHLLRWQ